MPSTPEDWLTRWDLTRDGPPNETASSVVVDVQTEQGPAVLKIATCEEEVRGAAVMEWYSGHSAARVLAREANAVLLERAEGPRDLGEMARSGQDRDATIVICDIVTSLHACTGAGPRPALVPLKRWFLALETHAAESAIFRMAHETARRLLDTPDNEAVLHGDIHHGNILDAGNTWVAIDPKGLIGEAAYDYANLFCNPDHETATQPDVFRTRVKDVCEHAGLDRDRLLAWILVHAALSACWSIDDSENPETALAVAGMAAADLKR